MRQDPAMLSSRWNEMAAPDTPVLSVVVAIVSDTTGRADTRHLDPCLDALTRQAAAEGAVAMEIIVPYHPSVDGIALMRQKYPRVRFLEASRLATYTGQGGS